MSNRKNTPKSLKKRINGKKVILSDHAIDRMPARKIKEDDIIWMLENYLFKERTGPGNLYRYHATLKKRNAVVVIEEKESVLIVVTVSWRD